MKGARRIFLAGHRGLVGSALLRKLALSGVDEVITRERAALDLTDQAAVLASIKATRPDAVILAAARVGGIAANARRPAEFIHDNLTIQSNVIHAAHLADVPRLLCLASSAVYPRDAPQPMAEEALLTGPLDPAHEPYAVAKIAGIKLCEAFNRQFGRDYRTVIPTNLYGPGDNFDPETGHVLPALIRRFHEAAERGDAAVTIWGSGRPRREFLHVDDMADAALFVLDLAPEALAAETLPMRSHVNVGTGSDISIRDLAGLVAEVTGFSGQIETDPSRPDGTPRKLMDISRLSRLGWTARIGLPQGIRDTWRWFVENRATLRG